MKWQYVFYSCLNLQPKLIDKQSGGLGAPQFVSGYGAILQQLRTRPLPDLDSDDLHPLAQTSVPA